MFPYIRRRNLWLAALLLLTAALLSGCKSAAPEAALNDQPTEAAGVPTEALPLPAEAPEMKSVVIYGQTQLEMHIPENIALNSQPYDAIAQEQAEEFAEDLLLGLSYAGYTTAEVEVVGGPALATGTRPDAQDLRLRLAVAVLRGEDPDVQPLQVNLYVLLRKRLEQMDFIAVLEEKTVRSYDTPELNRTYGNAYTAAALEAWYAIEDPSDTHLQLLRDVVLPGLRENVLPIAASGQDRVNYFGGDDAAQQVLSVLEQYLWFADHTRPGPISEEIPHVRFDLGGGKQIRFFREGDGLVELYRDGTYVHWTVQCKTTDADLYTAMWRIYDDQSLNLLGLYSSQSSLEAAVEEFAKHLIPDRHTTAPEDGLYYGLETKMVSYEILRVFAEGNKAECTVRYYVRQKTPSAEGYENAQFVTSGRYEGWLIMERKFSVTRRADQWYYDHN